jgi:hypothetical protein
VGLVSYGTGKGKDGGRDGRGGCMGTGCRRGVQVGGGMGLVWMEEEGGCLLEGEMR